MCGIFACFKCCASNNESKSSNLSEITQIVDAPVFYLLDRRGPDYSSPVETLTAISHNDENVNLKLEFKASILHLRGDELFKQPARDIDGNFLLFNGEIYEIKSHEGQDLQDAKRSDTQVLLNLFGKSKSIDEVVENISQIKIGTFALVYWHNSTQTLVVARDIFGRRSLCWSFNSSNTELLISSVVLSTNEFQQEERIWQEVPSNGVHCVRFRTNLSNCEPENLNAIDGSLSIQLYKWDLDRIYPPTFKCQSHSDEIKIDTEHKQKKFCQSKCIESKCEKVIRCPLVEELNYSENSPLSCENINNRFEKLLRLSIKRRLGLKKLICKDCKKISIQEKFKCKHCAVAVAFSGGIDSTILALLLDEFILAEQPIDLINVAFAPDAPDRLAALDACEELHKLRPNRNWQLVCVDVDELELKKQRNDHIRFLIAPLKTVIDDSIGCALWFAARGQGYCQHTNISVNWKSSEVPYTSPARLLFVGIGIDEQLGGYTSHRAAWRASTSVGKKKNNETNAINEEISFQMRRLPTRNLGRDDRVGGDHGRDLKLPFLDESLVDFLNGLPVKVKMDLSQPQGIGDKKLLRQFASELGLSKASQRVKRAMQFGTRIAKLEKSKEKGHEICDRL